MARIAKPLTDKELKNAKPKSSEYVLSDGFGLQVRVMSNGTKSWRFVYKSPETGKQSRVTLGTYPVLTIAKARLKAKHFRELVADCIDPKTFMQQQHDEYLAINHNTLYNVSKEWFQVKKEDVTPEHAEDIWRSLELHVFPSIKGQPISLLTAPQVIEVLKRVEAKGSLETVKRLTQRLNEIMIHAVNCGLIHSNPLAGIKSAFKKPQKENMKTLPPQELPQLMRSIANASIKPTTRCLLEFQLHTMTRPNEAAGARWEEFELEKGLWVIPAERMKKKREHRIPLTKEVLSLLSRMAEISSHGEYVFPADRDRTKPTNSQTANAALKRMGYAGRLVSHGLRSIASTTLNENGHDPDLIEAALAHVGGNEVRRAYNRTDYFELRKPMMDWWSEYIINASTGSLSMSMAS
ncbi:integrase domain-containing protein [Vibrio kanaloae]|uniref:integrase domain-containing protein n=1 Tax=Vibrio kanaloae TaxID=170673 RepID=UPI003551281E